MSGISLLRHLSAVVLLLLATTMGVGAATAATESQPEPWLELDQSTGPVGTTFTAWGNGFLPEVPVRISHPGLVRVDPDTPDVTDWSGHLSVTFRVAEGTPPGNILIEFRQAERIIARDKFEVQRP
jgi:hypothetical protein